MMFVREGRRRLKPRLHKRCPDGARTEENNIIFTVNSSTPLSSGFVCIDAVSTAQSSEENNVIFTVNSSTRGGGFCLYSSYNLVSNEVPLDNLIEDRLNIGLNLAILSLPVL